MLSSTYIRVNSLSYAEVFSKMMLVRPIFFGSQKQECVCLINFSEFAGEAH
jgi:hypothetical protein